MSTVNIDSSCKELSELAEIKLKICHFDWIKILQVSLKHQAKSQAKTWSCKLSSNAPLNSQVWAILPTETLQPILILPRLCGEIHKKDGVELVTIYFKRN